MNVNPIKIKHFQIRVNQINILSNKNLQFSENLFVYNYYSTRRFEDHSHLYLLLVGYDIFGGTENGILNILPICFQMAKQNYLCEDKNQIFKIEWSLFYTTIIRTCMHNNWNKILKFQCYRFPFQNRSQYL